MGWRDTIKPAQAKSWRDTITPAPKAADIPVEETSLESPSIELPGVEQASRSAIGGIGNAINSITGGVSDEVQARLGTGIDSALKYSGDLFTDGAPNPYEGQEPEELRQMNRDKIKSDRGALQDAAPIAFGGADLATSIAAPVNGISSLVGQSMLQGVGRSNKKGTELLKDVALSTALGAGPAVAFKGLGGAASALGNSKYGKAFKGGEDVQKYTDPTIQTDLSNKVSEAINDRVAQARLNHSGARESFTKSFGDVPVDASNVSSDAQAALSRFGDNTVSASGKELGAVTGRDAEELRDYMETLNNPQSASALYKIWDDIKTKVDHNDLLGISSEYNNRLKGLQAGIKEKLHSLSPDMAAADATMGTVSDQAKLLRAGAKDSTAESFLSTLGNRNKGNRREAFTGLLEDSPLLDDVDNFQTYQSFNGQGGAGSNHGLRNMAGTTIGGIAGSVLGPVGTMVGVAAGGIASSPTTQRAILTKSGDIMSNLGVNLPKFSPKYQKMLSEAQARGGQALATTHFLMSSQDPEYQAEVKRIQDSSDDLP